MTVNVKNVLRRRISRLEYMCEIKTNNTHKTMTVISEFMMKTILMSGTKQTPLTKFLMIFNTSQ